MTIEHKDKMDLEFTPKEIAELAKQPGMAEMYNEGELIGIAWEHGYQLVPIPKIIDHEFRPGDEVEEVVPEWMIKVVKKVKGTLEFPNKRATVLAVTSNIDILVRFHKTGRVGIITTNRLFMNPLGKAK